MSETSLSADAQRAVTNERLRWLSLAYMISGAIGAACVSFLLIHMCIFTALSFMPDSAWDGNSGSRTSRNAPASPAGKSLSPRSDAPPFIIFRVVAVAIGFVILIGWTLGGLTIYAGHCIKRRQRRTFVLVMAGFNCLWVPYGTLMGIATFMALSTEDARAEFPA